MSRIVITAVVAFIGGYKLSEYKRGKDSLLAARDFDLIGNEPSTEAEDSLDQEIAHGEEIAQARKEGIRVGREEAGKDAAFIVERYKSLFPANAVVSNHGTEGPHRE